jgi:REase_DpnII-MboI
LDHFERLTTSRRRDEAMAVIHYACESLHDATDHPPTVSCIVIRPIGGSTQLFSRTEAQPGTEPKQVEIGLLRRYFAALRRMDGTQFVHWNMSRAAYGFNAIESRFRFLTDEEPPYVISTSVIHDLDDLVEAKYGAEYASNPKLPTLAQLNGLTQRYALKGAEEPQRFTAGDFSAIDRSIEEKVGWISEILRLLLDGELRTLNSVGTTPFAGGHIDAVALVATLGQRLLYVQRELGKRHGNRQAMQFTDEYDDQDAFRSLLRIFFEDVRPEEYAPSYAGGSSRIDFLIPDMGIAVELKHSRKGLSAKEVGEQLVIDTERYASHPSVRHLVCIVIDHEGRLSNPRGLERDLARSASVDGLAVTVAIIDR